MIILRCLFAVTAGLKVSTEQRQSTDGIVNKPVDETLADVF